MLADGLAQIGSYMMTSSINGNIFRVTGSLCGEFTGHRWIPHTKASDAEPDVFFDLCLHKRLSKHSRRRWYETPSRSLWRHYSDLGHLQSRQWVSSRPDRHLKDYYTLSPSAQSRFWNVKITRMCGTLNGKLQKRLLNFGVLWKIEYELLAFKKKRDLPIRRRSNTERLPWIYTWVPSYDQTWHFHADKGMVLIGHCPCESTYTGQYRYNAVNYLHNPHNRHPLARPRYGVSVVILISDSLSATVIAVSHVI